jgi:hypothetical protein
MTEAPILQERGRAKTTGVDCYVEYTPHMATIQVVLEESLVRAADRAARRTKQNRSALIRDALREHLKRLRMREAEERDRQGYREHPPVEFRVWENVAAWPEE